MMPDKNGIETLHELKSQSGNPNLETPAVCLTANAVSGARAKYLAEGFDDYLTKPIDYVKLEEMLICYLPKDKTKLSGQEDAPKSPGKRAVKKTVKKECPDERLKALTGVPGMDISAGLANSGDVDSFIKKLKKFYNLIEENTVLLNSLCETGNLNNYAIGIQALKSSAQSIGAGRLGEEAEALQAAAEEGDGIFVRSRHPLFMEHYKALHSRSGRHV